jgi:hypothetical protein
MTVSTAIANLLLLVAIVVGGSLAMMRLRRFAEG